MARTGSQTKPPLTYALSYGLGGGWLHSRKINQLFRQTGWETAGRAEAADIIVAHSAGCWLIPRSAAPKLVVYIGMPLAQTAPRRTLAAAKKAAFQKNGVKHTLKQSLQNSYHLLREPRRNRDIIRRAKIAEPVIFPNAQAVFITNRHDPWPQSQALRTYLENQDWAFISLPGAHDDIWVHPERYAAITEHYARLLA